MSDSPTLPLRAENNPKFYGRFKWLGLGAIAFMAYCLYDGLVNYPNQQTRAVALLEVAEETLPDEVVEELSHAGHGAQDSYLKTKKRMADFPDFAEAWKSRAASEGWESTPPKKLRTDGDIISQYVMAGLSAVGGLWFLSTVARTAGRWFELTTEGVNTRWGESFSLAQITAIDKKQWRDKGIARIRYNDAKGRARTFVVDNYKYHKRTTDTILYAIEQSVGADKVVGGRPEADPNAPATDESSTPAGEPAEEASAEA